MALDYQSSDALSVLESDGLEQGSRSDYIPVLLIEWKQAPSIEETEESYLVCGICDDDISKLPTEKLTVLNDKIGILSQPATVHEFIHD